MGGRFTSAGGQPINRIAWWDGSAWKPFGTGIGAGSQYVDDLVVYGGDLIAGGVFFTAGGVPATGLARWDGSAWHDYTGGVVTSPGALVVHNGDLYAGGSFGGQQYSVMRRSNGVWEPIAFQGVQGHPITAETLGVYHGQIVAGSFFPGAYGYIFRFDGQQWLPLDDGLNAAPRAFTAWDPDGNGPMPDVLVAAGNFNWASGVTANGIAAWDGQQWSVLGSGLNGPGRALTVWNNSLIVGGTFGTAGGLVSPYFARYACPGCYPDCTADGVLTVSDFGCFQTRFVAGKAYADCNADGALTVADFGCFQTKLVVGCP